MMLVYTRTRSLFSMPWRMRNNGDAWLKKILRAEFQFFLQNLLLKKLFKHGTYIFTHVFVQKRYLGESCG